MSIIEKFQRSVADHADRIAVHAGSEQLTYRQLSDQALSLSQQIRAEQFIAEGTASDSVALLLSGKDAIVAILAVLHTGRTYVPLDNVYPSQRLAYILGDCKTSLLLTNNQNLELAYKTVHASGLDIQVLNIDNLMPAAAVPSYVQQPMNNHAALLYTSGSTGVPKKVAVTTEAVVSFCDHFREQLAIGPNDKLALTTSCSHAVSVLDIFGCLFAGAAILPYDVRNHFKREDFLACIHSQHITILHTVPAFFRYVAGSQSKEELASIRLVLLGGDTVQAEDLQLFRATFGRHARLANLYGQTELLLATMHVMDHDTVEEGVVLPVGYPISLVDAVIVAEDGTELPVMAKGELVFFEKESGRSIHTGDIGRWLADGTIEYIGRKDQQYKINGNRVHAAEVERAISQVAGIEKCIVLLNEAATEKQLTAYYTRTPGLDTTPALIKEEVRQFLAEHMVPQVLIGLDEFPRLPNGKIDRMALLAIKPNADDAAEQVPPELLARLTGIWEKVLGVEAIREDDNFFLLGGNSLHATEMVSHIYLAFQVELESGVIFDSQTITELARAVMMEIQEVNQLSENNKTIA